MGRRISLEDAKLVREKCTVSFRQYVLDHIENTLIHDVDISDEVFRFTTIRQLLDKNYGWKELIDDLQKEAYTSNEFLAQWMEEIFKLKIESEEN